MKDIKTRTKSTTAKFLLKMKKYWFNQSGISRHLVPGRATMILIRKELLNKLMSVKNVGKLYSKKKISIDFL